MGIQQKNKKIILTQKMKSAIIFLSVLVLFASARHHRKQEESSNDVEFQKVGGSFQVFGHTVGGHVEYGSKWGASVNAHVDGKKLSAYGQRSNGGFKDGKHFMIGGLTLEDFEVEEQSFEEEEAVEEEAFEGEEGGEF